MKSSPMKEEVPAGIMTRKTEPAVHNPGWYIIRGTFAATLGLIVTVFPFAAWLSITFLVAGYACLDGVIALLAAPHAPQHRRWSLLLRGGTGVLVGIAFLFLPFLTMISVGMLALLLLVVWCLATGTIEITDAYQHRRDSIFEWLLVVYGLLTLCAGVALFLSLILAPGWTLLSLAAVIGVFGIISGIVLLVNGIGLWRAGRRIAQGRLA